MLRTRLRPLFAQTLLTDVGQHGKDRVLFYKVDTQSEGVATCVSYHPLKLKLRNSDWKDNIMESVRG